MRFTNMHSHEYHLMQLADSFFPSGMFSASNGLESLVRTGLIDDKDDILAFIIRQIRMQLIPCDCIVMVHVLRNARKKRLEEIVEADKRYYAIKQTFESRIASVRSGRQILECINYALRGAVLAGNFKRVVIRGMSPGTYPVALALAAHSFGLPRESLVRLMLYSYSVNVIGAALRLGAIQHLDAQKMLVTLRPEIEAAVSSVKSQDSLEFVWQFSPLVDILQMQHEHYEQRMFIT